MYLTSEIFRKHQFESVVILNIDEAEMKKVRIRKRALPSIIGFTAKAIIRYTKFYFKVNYKITNSIK